MSLDSPERIHEIREIIRSKPALRSFYESVYESYRSVLKRCPSEGVALELGSGGGFTKSVLPEMVTSDLLPYPGLDRHFDATQMPFQDGELRAICMLNVFHHIPDVSRFLAEATRCLKPGGKLFIVDQHPGWIGRFVYQYAHHEPFNAQAQDWKFESTGPLSGANGALAWIVFQRDRERLAREFPFLSLENYTPHTPLLYWLSGGLKNWTLVPRNLLGWARAADRTLIGITPQLGSFVNIELTRKPNHAS